MDGMFCNDNVVRWVGEPGIRQGNAAVAKPSGQESRSRHQTRLLSPPASSLQHQQSQAVHRHYLTSAAHSRCTDHLTCTRDPPVHRDLVTLTSAPSPWPSPQVNLN